MGENLQQLLANEFTDDLAHALGGMTGEQPKAVPHFHFTGLREECIAWRQRFNAAPGAAWLCAPPETWVSIGLRTLKAAGIDDEDPAMARSTFAEVLGQAFSMLARSISGRTAREWLCEEGSEQLAPHAGDWTEIALSFSDGRTERVFVRFEEGLTRALEAPPEPPATLAPAPPRQESQKDNVQIESPVKSRTLDLLLDVELPVSVSFGRAQLPLKDVVKLTTGSIVELNRTIMEPVEVIVNNCVIARGEVVVVDGNFGVRIQQVISRQERLCTLF
jgi:flagellar motor switch protein FliN/FliY